MFRKIYFAFFIYFVGLAVVYAQTTVNLPESEAQTTEPDNDLQTSIIKGSYEVLTDEVGVLRSARDHAGSAAKSLGRSLNLYLKEKQIQAKQRELIMRFNAAFSDLTQSLKLNDVEREHLLAEVEEVYIKDAEEDKNKLDQITFRDLPDVVQAVYSQMELERTENGTVDTYYLNGALKTKWVLKNGKPEGAIVTYYENGEMRFIDLYKDGRRINRKKYNEEGKLEFEQDYLYEIVKS